MRSVATTPEQLLEVAGVTHDAYFDARDIVHDESRQMIVIPFAQEAGPWDGTRQDELVRRSRLSSEYRVPFTRGFLTIRHVVGTQSTDGWGDMGMLVGLDFDDARKQVRLESGSYLRVTVSELLVEVEVTDEVVGHAPRRVSKCLPASAEDPPR